MIMSQSELVHTNRIHTDGPANCNAAHNDDIPACAAQSGLKSKAGLVLACDTKSPSHSVCPGIEAAAPLA